MEEPTSDQCSNKDVVFEGNNEVGIACWYPQMGGYTGKAVAVFDKQWEEYDNGTRCGGCVDVYVWHDGEFPFGDGEPRKIHHCSGGQFIDFGEFIEKETKKRRILKKFPTSS